MQFCARMHNSHLLHPHFMCNALYADMLFLLQKYSFWPHSLLLWGIHRIFWAISLWRLVHATIQCYPYLIACHFSRGFWTRRFFWSLFTGESPPLMPSLGISSSSINLCHNFHTCNSFLQFPALYQQGPRNLFFDWYRIFGWMGNGLYTSLIIFFLNIIIFYDQAFRSAGQTADMSAVGTTMFTCIICAVNCQIALTMSHFTWIQHLFVWGSITTWYIFLLLYGMTSPLFSGTAYQILVEALAPAPMYWCATLLVIVTCNLPYLVHISFQRSFNPMDHHIIQEIKYYRKDVEDQYMWTRERSKARQETKIGFSARVDAKIRQLRGKLQKKHSPTATNVQTPLS